MDFEQLEALSIMFLTTFFPTQEMMMTRIFLNPRQFFSFATCYNLNPLSILDVWFFLVPAKNMTERVNKISFFFADNFSDSNRYLEWDTPRIQTHCWQTIFLFFTFGQELTGRNKRVDLLFFCVCLCVCISGLGEWVSALKSASEQEKCMRLKISIILNFLWWLIHRIDSSQI